MNVSKRKSPKKRVQLCVQKSSPKHKTVSVGTDLQWETRITELEARVVLLEKQLNETRACTLSIDTILQNDTKVQFYTGFPSQKHFEICFKFLGPSVSCLQYWGSQNASKQHGRKCGPQRKLSPLEEFFLIMIRLRVGLLEEDLADRFGVHLSTISRIFITWINFSYHKLKSISLWPSKAQIQ